MSGGVDSAVAAARAVGAGPDVTGVHKARLRTRPQTRSGARGCCSIEDASDARRAADRLAIPYYVWDLSEDFEELVVADFLAEYAAGRTPNPCVRCNEHVKFAVLLRRARALGFDAVCTGHYATLTVLGEGGAAGVGAGAGAGLGVGLGAGVAPAVLARARDRAKDQS
jgi:tRNA-specific 2-thiouridylase